MQEESELQIVTQPVEYKSNHNYVASYITSYTRGIRTMKHVT